ncbi:hypothetical protein E3N88_27834 [Mikania micrantha]|uniref:Uncharacterized protein n=1 Tax=Mikania micrantha TaxID=192012 RepID=A0A5N6MXS8_9ASTR|nr:hypothetical protein E3N88_27834 [Mikania micrantha]
METLEFGFEYIKMKENERVDDFAAKIGGLVSNVASLGLIWEEKKLVRKILGFAPPKCIPLVTSIKQFADLKTIPFQEAIGSTSDNRGKGKADNSGVSSKGKNQQQD